MDFSSHLQRLETLLDSCLQLPFEQLFSILCVQLTHQNTHLLLNHRNYDTQTQTHTSSRSLPQATHQIIIWTGKYVDRRTQGHTHIHTPSLICNTGKPQEGFPAVFPCWRVCFCIFVPFMCVPVKVGGSAHETDLCWHQKKWIWPNFHRALCYHHQRSHPFSPWNKCQNALKILLFALVNRGTPEYSLGEPFIRFILNPNDTLKMLFCRTLCGAHA